MIISKSHSGLINSHCPDTNTATRKRQVESSDLSEFIGDVGVQDLVRGLTPCAAWFWQKKCLGWNRVTDRMAPYPTSPVSCAGCPVYEQLM